MEEDGDVDEDRRYQWKIKDDKEREAEAIHRTTRNAIMDEMFESGAKTVTITDLSQDNE